MKEIGNMPLIILEDDVAHAEAIRRSLAVLGNKYEIITAASLREFNHIISNTVPQLVIADMNLPDGNAFAILQDEPENLPWPVLVLTSYGDEEMAVKAIKSGALDYIVKSPEAFGNIRYTVDRMLREWCNIQKYRQAEIALRESEKKFRTLFETMSQGVIYQDAKGQGTFANPAALKILGLTLEQMQEQTSLLRYGRAIHEDGSDFSSETYPAMIALHSGIPVKDVVIGIYNLSRGEYKWLLMTAIPQFRENEPEPYQVFTTFTDITRIKFAEEALQKKNAELIRAKEKAEESDRLKSAFMANMSHEIRTPMNGILGFADLLRSPHLSDESQKKYIDIIQMSGKRMLNIINDLIDISKIEAGQIETRNEITDIGLLMEELQVFFMPEANKKGLTLTCNNDLPLDRMSLNTDKTKLMQIIMNLIKNALKFTSKGYIEFGCKLQDNTYVFYVKDTGIGIRKELQVAIFERFRQGEVAVSQIQEGVGLGLAISKAYVELLGGTISVESEQDKGAFFWFTVPAKEPVAVQKFHKEYSKLATSLPYSNILVAEDDETSSLFLKEILGIYQATTYFVKDGIEAMSVFKRHPDIDLVLMDIKMPGMSGLEAVRQMKEIRPDVLIFVQSAFVSEMDIKKAFQAGCDDYITKPIEKESLLNKMIVHAENKANSAKI